MYVFIVLQVPSSRSRFQQTWFFQIMVSTRKNQLCASLTVSGGLLTISRAQMYHFFFLLCVDVSLSCSLHLFMVLSVCLLVQKGPIVQKGSTVGGLVPKCCLISSVPQISTATLFPDKFKFSSQSFQHRNAGDTKFNP